ncbi:Uncharacterised protein [Salmonella enterica subsp. salamae]|uniref:Uncharacterized protein n=1 Tax=Salmonella enterica subsp. salamae TaxID=59202 RepID=A0A6D2G3M6_SALER|nr:Uncharacterised protein [Salmonella enterica subsp. salamae]
MQARKQLVHPFDTLLKPIALGKKTAHRQILFHRHSREDAPPFRHYRHRFTHDFRRLPVSNVFTVKHHPSAGGARIAAQGAKQRRFPRAVSANQGNDFPLVDVQTDVVQRLNLAVVGADFFKR